MNYVCVIWHDAHAAAVGWESVEELKDDEPYVVKSVGYQLTKDTGAKRGHVSLAQSLSTDLHVDSVIHIPKKMVQKIITLSETEMLNRQILTDAVDYLTRVVPRGFDDERRLTAVIAVLNQSIEGGVKSSSKPQGRQPDVSQSR